MITSLFLVGLLLLSGCKATGSSINVPASSGFASGSNDVNSDDGYIDCTCGCGMVAQECSCPTAREILNNR